MRGKFPMLLLCICDWTWLFPRNADSLCTYYSHLTFPHLFNFLVFHQYCTHSFHFSVGISVRQRWNKCSIKPTKKPYSDWWEGKDGHTVRHANLVFALVRILPETFTHFVSFAPFASLSCQITSFKASFTNIFCARGLRRLFHVSCLISRNGESGMGWIN